MQARPVPAVGAATSATPGRAGRILAPVAAADDEIPAAQASLRLAHVLEDSGFLLCRYVRKDAS